MARGSQQATGAATSAQNLSNQFGGNAQALYGGLTPELESMATHPAGFGAADLASMNTAAQQSAGGSQAGAEGKGALLASRTKNAGAAQNAIAQSARQAGQQESNAAVGIQAKNAQAKMGQQQSALKGLEGLYGINAGQATGALGQVANNVNANTNAANASWDWSKYLLDPMLSAGASGAGAYYGRP